MDDIVKQALLKWPNVPDCYGWLGLDARGNWFMRDERAQAQGPFTGGSAPSKGSMLKHDKLIDFIGRNYQPNAEGQWFFQNGPQRVYVELQATPLIWRVHEDLSVQDHCGRAASVQHCLLDELGRVYLATSIGFGLVHSLDMGYVADAVEQGLWLPQEVLCSDLPTRFNYVPSPLSLQ
ncbi:MAG TPA: DUF2946 family protein [Rhodoferax sp.]